MTWAASRPASAADIAALRAPSFARCVVILCLTRLTLRSMGFARALSLLRWCTMRLPSRTDATSHAVSRIAERVAMAAAFFPGRALCLEQSVALFYLLRRRGIAAELRIGVQPSPFAAHAWVEYLDQPINEDTDHVQRLLRLPIRIEGAR